MLRPLLIAVLIYATTLTAAAQQTETLAAPLQRPAPKTISDWPVADASVPQKINVLTLARPGVRRKCQVRDLTPDALLCESAHHHPTTTYNRDEIAALIAPASHSERNIKLVPLALMAASLVGSFFVPLAWAITLRVFTGLFFGAFGAMSVGDTSDHGEYILYQRPNTPLTLTIRTR